MRLAPWLPVIVNGLPVKAVPVPVMATVRPEHEGDADVLPVGDSAIEAPLGGEPV
jgi:hypothetical protein